VLAVAAVVVWPCRRVVWAMYHSQSDLYLL
jgi:hypothetical protein